MADGTNISWTEATWNPITGCSVISPGCTNCYAMKLAGARLRDHPSRKGLTKQVNGQDVWTGEVRFNEAWLRQPIEWGRPRMIFVCAHADLFHVAVSREWVDRIFAVMALSPHHTFQVLTKRADIMQGYMTDPETPRRIARIICDDYHDLPGKRILAPLANRAEESDPEHVTWPLPNVWMGVSVEDQKRLDERTPILRATPAAFRWISAEPLLGPLAFDPCDLASLDWLVVGGENGPRPMHPDWARSLRDQCAVAGGVPFHFKQWGTYATVFDRDVEDPDWRDCGRWQHERPKGRWHNLAGGTGFHGERVVYVDPVGKKAAGRLLDGIEHNAMPEVRRG
ncbi:phage Gp37/Gp68 family protein [Novosphingobium sp. FKTRR1]|uniref:phage Gp37/Gp68 family protein n=1 Tax=Novosphingobium sp. FKTRR1 TaxID=2879118 RepID=UPI001CF068C2|nr:phage Gp37/Gp68 family protein [Novosphingobium sp. FKTRR1]